MNVSEEDIIAKAWQVVAQSDYTIVIDRKPTLQHDEDGCWVAAWVWVADDGTANGSSEKG